jgi:adenosylcobinamide-phosphate synthase
VEHATLLVLCFVLDGLIGEPPWLPHPVTLIGKAIERGEVWLRPERSPPREEVLLGCGLVVGVVVGTYATAEIGLRSLAAVSWVVGYAVTVFLGSLCLARRSLREHAEAVLAPLREGDLHRARVMLGRIVSRETAGLPERDIIRGTVESVAENSSDGVIAPLFYLALGGVPLALAYKAVSTLDSMIGYRTARYEYFGKAAARLDDVANLIPARLTALAVVGAAWVLQRFGRPFDCHAAWAVTLRDGRKHASPNAGYPEAAFAGALGVRLGGPGRYFGAVVEKPAIGEARRPLSPEHISLSLMLLDGASVLALAVFLVAGCGS